MREVMILEGITKTVRACDYNHVEIMKRAPLKPLCYPRDGSEPLMVDAYEEVHSDLIPVIDVWQNDFRFDQHEREMGRFIKEPYDPRINVMEKPRAYAVAFTPEFEELVGIPVRALIDSHEANIASWAKRYDRKTVELQDCQSALEQSNQSLEKSHREIDELNERLINHQELGVWGRLKFLLNTRLF